MLVSPGGKGFSTADTNSTSMPIGGDRFEDIDDDGPTPGTNAHAIVSFLAANSEQAYTQSEIVAATDVTRGSVGPTLVRLRERGHVDHRGTYWRIADRTGAGATASERRDGTDDTADGDTADAVEAGNATADDGLDYEDWQAYAVDPRDGEDGYEAGAVVWASGPGDGGGRPWLVLTSDSLPAPVREYTCVALTAGERPDAVTVADEWRVGHHPDRTVACVPDERAAIAHRSVHAPQGAVDPSFVERLRR